MKDDVMRVKDAVKQCLEDDQRCRDSDKWLIVKVIHLMGFRVYIPFDSMEDMPSFESITRCRRKFQEEGLFLSTDATLIKRTVEQDKMKDINQWWQNEKH